MLRCSLGANARSEFYFAGREQDRLRWEELSNQGTGIVEAFDLLAGKLRKGCFSPISNELDRVDEVFFL